MAAVNNQSATKQDILNAIKAIQGHNEIYTDNAVKTLKLHNEEHVEGAVTSILDALEMYATKEEVKKIVGDEIDKRNLATKDDLKREVGWVRDDINGLKAEISSTPSLRQFNELKQKIVKLSSN